MIRRLHALLALIVRASMRWTWAEVELGRGTEREHMIGLVSREPTGAIWVRAMTDVEEELAAPTRYAAEHVLELVELASEDAALDAALRRKRSRIERGIIDALYRVRPERAQEVRIEWSEGSTTLVSIRILSSEGETEIEEAEWEAVRADCARRSLGVGLPSWAFAHWLRQGGRGAEPTGAAS